MSKKFEKLLFGAALAGAAIAGGIAYLNKCKKEETWEDDFDDFEDDFDEDLDKENASAERGYVTIPKEDTAAEPEATAEEPGETTDEKSVAENLSDALSDTVDRVQNEL